jgi:hypothetical protein
MRRVAAPAVDGLSLRVGFMPEPPPGWLAADELLGREGPMTALFSRVAGVRERPAEHICAEWMIESWARAAAGLAGATLICDRRLPDLRPENLVIAPYKGMIGATAVRTEAMAALEGDRAAIRAGADLVPGWIDLADLMHTGLESLLGPMIRWAADRELRPAKTLWQAAGDCLAQSLVWSGRAFAEADFALELTRYLMGRGGRMAVPVERELDESGQPFHLRTTCCLAYRTPEGGLCRACPIKG